MKTVRIQDQLFSAKAVFSFVMTSQEPHHIEECLVRVIKRLERERPWTSSEKGMAHRDNPVRFEIKPFGKLRMRTCIVELHAASHIKMRQSHAFSQHAANILSKLQLMQLDGVQAIRVHASLEAPIEINTDCEDIDLTDSGLMNMAPANETTAFENVG